MVREPSGDDSSSGITTMIPFTACAVTSCQWRLKKARSGKSTSRLTAERPRAGGGGELRRVNAAGRGKRDGKPDAPTVAALTAPGRDAYGRACFRSASPRRLVSMSSYTAAERVAVDHDQRSAACSSFSAMAMRMMPRERSSGVVRAPSRAEQPAIW